MKHKKSTFGLLPLLSVIKYDFETWVVQKMDQYLFRCFPEDLSMNSFGYSFD